jgi:hypothetical protein
MNQRKTLIQLNIFLLIGYPGSQPQRPRMRLPDQMEDDIMPRGEKTAYTDKQKRKAEHIEEGYREQGVSKDEAERRAWATVNKEDGGGKKSGSGRRNHKPS